MTCVALNDETLWSGWMDFLVTFPSPVWIKVSFTREDKAEGHGGNMDIMDDHVL